MNYVLSGLVCRISLYPIYPANILVSLATSSFEDIKPRPNDRNMPTQHVACVWSPCCGVVGSKLTIFKFEPTTPNMSQHIATRWPNARNRLRPTMLRHVALACCDRLAGALWKVRERTFDNRENTACVTVRKNKTVLLDT